MTYHSYYSRSKNHQITTSFLPPSTSIWILCESPINAYFFSVYFCIVQFLDRVLRVLEFIVLYEGIPFNQTRASIRVHLNTLHFTMFHELVENIILNGFFVYSSDEKDPSGVRLIRSFSLISLVTISFFFVFRLIFILTMSFLFCFLVILLCLIAYHDSSLVFFFHLSSNHTAWKLTVSITFDTFGDFFT